MSITNGYLTLDEAQSYIGEPYGTSSDQLEDAVTSVSRQIDGYCQRHFWQTGTVQVGVARRFTASDGYVIHLGPFNDLVSATAVTDDGAAVTTYQLEPRNVAGPETRPFTSIRRTSGTWTIPTVDDLAEVTITGVWGWPAVPAAVKQACRLQVARMFKRADSPLGVAGFGEFGVVRVTQLDPDVKALLAPYRLLVGLA
jgi:hypothetical protein